MNIIGKEELKKAMEAFFNQISIFMRFVAIPQPTEWHSTNLCIFQFYQQSDESGKFCAK